jgi:dTMP kinase
MDRYPFVVIEGLDGTGKGLFRLMEGLYRLTPLAVLTTNFLDAGVAFDLVDGKYRPTAENQPHYLAALAADKRATSSRLISPSLAVRPVIADRWLLSELAFFAVKHDMSPAATYAALTSPETAIPDLTFVLDIEPEIAMQRAASRSGDATRADWDVLGIQSKVRAVYHGVIGSPAVFPALGDIVLLDASHDRATLLHTAWQALEQKSLLPGKLGADT